MSMALSVGECLGPLVIKGRTFPTIPERVDALVFIMIWMKALTVLGLMFIRSAISLLVNPWTRNSTVFGNIPMTTDEPADL